MKEYVLYQCDFCGTQYNSKTACELCESKHVKPESIFSTKYVAMNNGNSDGYPVKIRVRFENGQIIDYRRQKENK